MIQMYVNEIYKIRDRTIFSGTFSSNEFFIKGQTISLMINHQKFSRITISGFVNNHSNIIDLWTTDSVALTQNDLIDNTVILQSMDE